jgi:hypothetical protein
MQGLGKFPDGGHAVSGFELVIGDVLFDLVHYLFIERDVCSAANGYFKHSHLLCTKLLY